MRSLCTLLCLSAACAGDPNTVLIDLSPSVISSLDGSTTVTALVAADSTPLADEHVTATITYTDRNGTAHAIDPVEGTTNPRGVFIAKIDGLTWDGTGSISVATGNGTTGVATFTVLDRTPPTVEIVPPTSDLKVGPGLPMQIQVHVTDEIGVSRVTVDANRDLGNFGRTTIVASASPDSILTFDTDVPVNTPSGPTLTIYATASDLSGNIGVAKPLTLTVDPSITISTPPGLSGSLLADGTVQKLNDPRAILFSPKDNHLYVADVAGSGACSPTCIWRVDPTSGAIDTTPVYVGAQEIEGIAIDATGDNLYLSDRGNRMTSLVWGGTAYATPTSCSATQDPQDPYHLVYDATLGMVVADGQDKNLQNVATCTTTSTGAAISAQNTFDQPRGVAAGPSGELYVSDFGNDRVSLVNRTTGAVTTYASNIDTPYGIEWLGTTVQAAFANSLLVASMGQREIISAKNGARLAASYLRNTPIDLTVAGGAMYILTTPSAANRGRIYRVTGF